jgi:hypothetical protein
MENSVETNNEYLNEIDDDDDAIRDSIKQGMRDILSGNVLSEEDFWLTVADN